MRANRPYASSGWPTWRTDVDDLRNRLAIIGATVVRRRPLPVQPEPCVCGRDRDYFILPSGPKAPGAVVSTCRCGTGAPPIANSGYLTKKEEWRYGYSGVTIAKVDGIWYYEIWKV